MQRLILWMVALFGGSVVGLGSALLLTAPVNLSGQDIKVEAWKTLKNTGESANNPSDRARIAMLSIKFVER